LAEIILNETMIAEDEPYFIAYVDRPKGAGQTIVAELAMGLVGPVTKEQMKPRKLSGFELPALELLHKAHERAAESGVRKILLVDPLRLLPLAKIHRYAQA